VGNKGVAGRALFTGDEERIHFLVLLACAVRRGWIEVHAYCLMDNHFHLLVRSPHGDLSVAMQWIEDSYARWFNLRHERFGPLFAGRFWGKLIHTITYRRAVFAYTHANPERAELEIPPGGYPWSSKRHYARGCGCPWLTRTFGSRLSPALQDGVAVPGELVERWAAAPGQDERELDWLLRQRWNRVQAWLARNARLADGASRQRFLVCPRTLERLLGEHARDAADETVLLGKRRHGLWSLLESGLRRTACAQPYQRIADRADVAIGTAHQRVQRHLRALQEDAHYAAVAGRVLEACLRADYELLVS
jgi:REP element-mobilizing transposase RayT